jgi:ribosome maturation factor RimP
LPQDEELQLVRSLAQRVAGTFGLALFDLQFRHESIGRVLRVVIDRPAAAPAAPRDPYEESVSIADCQRVSHDLSALLDVEDAIEDTYTLEVSSPGLDRPLRDADDYRRFVGRLAKIVVSEAIDRQTHFGGRLRGLENDDVVLEEPGGRLRRIPRAAIARARLEVEF